MKKIIALMRIAIPVSIALLFVFAACNETVTEPQTDPTVLSGILTDEYDTPVPYAVLTAYELTEKIEKKNNLQGENIISVDTSDEDGNYQMKNLPENLTNVMLRIEHEDFGLFEENMYNLVKNKNKGDFPIKLSHDDSCCGYIKIETFDADSNRLANAEIRLNRGNKVIRKAKTNNDGVLEFFNVCEGEYWVRVAREGYFVVEQEFIIEECDSVYRNYYLQRKEQEKDTCCDGKIVIHAEDIDTGEPLIGALVNLWQDGKLKKKGHIEGNSIVFSDLCEGTYGVDIVLKGYKSIEFHVEIGCDEEKELTKQLEKDSCCNSIVYLSLKDENGEPIIEAKVKLWFGNSMLEHQYTNREGLVVFDGLCEGKYQFSFFKDGFKGQEFNFEVGCNVTKEFEKVMLKDQNDSCCNGAVKIWLFDKENNEPLNGAKVKLWRDGKLIETAEVKDGYVIFDGLCEGKYGFDLIKDGYKTQEFVMEFGCNEEKEAEKFLEKEQSPCKGILKVIVKDEDSGEALNGAKVKLWKDGKAVEAVEVRDGIAIFDGLCDGVYGISVIKEGYSTKEAEVEVKSGETTEKIIKMSKNAPCKGNIKIYPKDKDTKELIKGAKVRLWKDGKLIEEQTVENGWVIFDGLPEGKYALDIIKDGYKGIEFAVELGCNKTVEHVKEMEKDGSNPCCNSMIMLNIKDENTKKAISEVKVKLWQNGTIKQTKYTNQNGYAEMKEVCEGRYYITMEKSGFSKAEWEFDVDCKDTISETKYMKAGGNDTCCTAKLKLRILDKITENPIERATIKLRIDGNVIKETTSNSEGWALIEGICVPPNEYEAVIIKDGYKGQEIEVKYDQCNIFQETIRMEED